MLQAESDIPAFHYGSHYSAAGTVLFYLIRLEPFTRLNRNLQVLPCPFVLVCDTSPQLCCRPCAEGFLCTVACNLMCLDLNVVESVAYQLQRCHVKAPILRESSLAFVKLTKAVTG